MPSSSCRHGLSPPGQPRQLRDSLARWLAPWQRRDVDESLRIAAIRKSAAGFSSLSLAGLAQATAELRRAVPGGTDLLGDDIVIPLFALVAEAVKRVLRMELFDVQLAGGLALARGGVVELQTGEGKTVVALLPASLHALAGTGVHVMTVNNYLARRDFEFLSPVYRALGLSAGVIEAGDTPAVKKAAYARDVTYGAGHEFGFDYLRDQVALFSQQKQELGDRFRQKLRGDPQPEVAVTQRGQAAAIVDEADSVMIDEATTPLILSAGGEEPSPNHDLYQAARSAAARLVEGRDFERDDSSGAIQLTRTAIDAVNAEPRIGEFALDRPWQVYVQQALRAEYGFRRDVEYVVRDDRVQLVDRHTGRVFKDRSWREGLQQAIQAKEGVAITAETRPLARITRQRYFSLYDRLSGMTGTVRGAEEEFREVYGLPAVLIPPNRTCRRKTLPHRIFADQAAKDRAIVDAIGETHRRGQPVLVGTGSIETSERLAYLLEQAGIAFQLLNGKQDRSEAELVARAGQLGCVTIATNMAGRGTDIRLGPGVAEKGGLHVIVTEPQESARADRQLIGRAARQGDPGSCQHFAAASDSFLRLHASRLARQIQQRTLRDELREAAHLVRSIAAAQRQVERAQTKLRRQLFQQEDWLDDVLSRV